MPLATLPNRTNRATTSLIVPDALAFFPLPFRQTVRALFAEGAAIKAEPGTLLDHVRQTAQVNLYRPHLYKNLHGWKRLLDYLRDEPDAALAFAQSVLMQTGGQR